MDSQGDDKVPETLKTRIPFTEVKDLQGNVQLLVEICVNGNRPDLKVLLRNINRATQPDIPKKGYLVKLSPVVATCGSAVNDITVSVFIQEDLLKETNLTGMKLTNPVLFIVNCADGQLLSKEGLCLL